jgi:regulator of protease activity HflC (stomatin/prohibitin superfamily)
MLWIFLAIFTLLAVAGLSVWKTQYEARLKKEGKEGVSFPVPSGVRAGMLGLAVVLFFMGAFNQIFFYAEPGYIYHVRTILGQERVVDGVGYSMHLFGRKNAWKKAMTVVAEGGNGSARSGDVDAEGEGSLASARLPIQNIMFLDQVDANAMATVRFRLPTDAETFLKMAHEYRTPENLLRVALIPAFQETLQATGSLMSAESYYSGGRTEFISEFENQMQNGIYLVKRNEVLAKAVGRQTSEADASKPAEQAEFGDQRKTIFVVQKQYDDQGRALRKAQKFTSYGVSVHEARVTNMQPNAKFVERMQLKQKASADRAIAREQRIQEEEQRLLAVARGDREVAERQAKMKVEQIEMTTKAETDKKQVLIAASKQKEQAEIQRETSLVLLEKAKIDAEAVRVAAEAEAYRKEKILSADNALAQKLEAEIEIQRVWAQAYASRKVPQYVLGVGGAGADATPVGADSEVKNFMQLMTIDAAKRLNYDRGLDNALMPAQ